MDARNIDVAYNSKKTTGGNKIETNETILKSDDDKHFDVRFNTD